MPLHPAAAVSIPRLFAGLVGGDPGRPAVTWIDPPSGARVELSRATLANWVAKIGGLLQDVVEVGSGDTVRLRLPSHWLSVAWPLACWTVGAVVRPGDADADPGTDAGPVDVEVVGDEGDAPSSATTAAVDRLVVVGLAPLGGRSRTTLPPGALDAGAEVLGQPDLLVALDPPGPGSPASGERDHAGMLADARSRAGVLGLQPGARLATDLGPCTAAGLVETVLSPLVVGGSLVLVTTPDDAALAAERPDAMAGSLRG